MFLVSFLFVILQKMVIKKILYTKLFHVICSFGCSKSCYDSSTPPRSVKSLDKRKALLTILVSVVIFVESLPGTSIILLRILHRSHTRYLHVSFLLIIVSRSFRGLKLKQYFNTWNKATLFLISCCSVILKQAKYFYRLNTTFNMTFN